ncbi:hypothetical protein TL16_g01161 [Triparma laevis f. inornata]|uniref:BZIP domain-containing protein n=1 Tax=Triparma laevis f. inornata TaxID=1714386 RepID=A0A9W6ZKW5_9STRA|nr:hypothetical protein TL16_g01161 [Triparma laevis f. inornata]
MDAKTLARAKNREQAKKSREKKKRAIEGMSEELNEARMKLKEQEDFLDRAQEKLKLYDEMVETNRKLAEENLRLQSILFPDPDDPLAMATPGTGGSSEGGSKGQCSARLSLAHNFIDHIQNGCSWEDGVAELCTDDDAEFHSDSMPRCETIQQFADTMVETTKVVFADFKYIRKSSTCDGEQVTVVCMAQGSHVAKGQAEPVVPPKSMNAMAVFFIKFVSTKHEGKKIESVDLIFDTHTAYCQLGWPLVCFLKPKTKPREGGLVANSKGGFRFEHAV